MSSEYTGVKRLNLMAGLAASVKAAIGTPQAGSFMLSAEEVIKLAEDVNRDVEAAFKAGWEMSETAGVEDKWDDAFSFFNQDVERPDVPS